MIRTILYRLFHPLIHRKIRARLLNIGVKAW